MIKLVPFVCKCFLEVVLMSFDKFVVGYAPEDKSDTATEISWTIGTRGFTTGPPAESKHGVMARIDQWGYP
jgi:hypothetical protein